VSKSLYKQITPERNNKLAESHQQNNSNRKSSSNIWIGLIFIFGGVAVLLNQLGLLPFELNWWALFILMPAAGLFQSAYNRFRANDNMFSMDAAMPALIGLFLAALSFSLLVDGAWEVNWSLFWPLIIILIGLGMIFGRSKNG
jgi:hypothetical protein